jgi:hypothetical protein
MRIRVAITTTVPGFTMQLQPCDSLCWAAVTLSVNLWRKPQLALTMCTVVQDSLGVTDCCSELNAVGSCACNEDCNQDFVLFNALQAVNALEHTGVAPNMLTGTTEAGTIWSSIQSEIDQGRVICCKIDFGGVSNHYVVVWSYTTYSNGSITVAVQDPLYPSQSWELDQFLNNYNGCGGVCCELTTIM